MTLPQFLPRGQTKRSDAFRVQRLQQAAYNRARGSHSRTCIVRFLRANGDARAVDIAPAVRLTPRRVRGHLGLLVAEGIVRRDPRGRYALSTSTGAQP